MPIACGWLCNYVLTLQDKPEPIYPTVVVAIAAFIVARTFALVFSCVLDTLFVCCVRDKTEYKGVFMSDRLRLAFGFDKKSKTKAEGSEKSGGGGDEYVGE